MKKKLTSTKTIDIRHFILGELQTNCYLLQKDKQCIIIDPGDEGSFLLEILQREQLQLVAIIATHGHFDHIMAVGEIQLSYDVPLYIHEKDLFLVKRLNETAQYFLGFDPVALPPKKVNFLVPGDLKIENFKLKIISTPGHTPGSVCLLTDNRQSASDEETSGVKEERPNPIVFTGDTLFKGAIGRYDFSYSDKKLLDESLVILLKLPENTTVYPGHGEETTIGEEKIGY